MTRSGEMTSGDWLLRAIGGAAALVSILVLLVVLAYFGMPVFSGPTLVLPWFLPTMNGFCILVAACVAFLAFGRHRAAGDPASFWMGIGFSGFAIGMLFNILSLPGLLPDGSQLTGRLSNTAAWAATVALQLLATSLLAAILMRQPGGPCAWPRGWVIAVAGWIGFVTAAYILFIFYEERLPVLIRADGNFSSVHAGFNTVALGLETALGVVLSARRYIRRRDTLWGYAAICQLTLLSVAILNTGMLRRYDAWWYTQRLLWAAGLVAALFGLLSEYVRLFREQQQKNRQLEEREREREADMAAMRRVEESLRQSEERFRATFEQAAVGIAQVSPDGRWLRVNRRLCQIVGYPREELLVTTFQDITYAEDLNSDLTQVQRLLAGEIDTYSMEKRYRRKDGELVWVNLTVSLIRDARREPAYFISVVQDITERKQAEQAVRASEERFRAVLENMSEGLMLFDAQGNLIYQNPASLRIHGFASSSSGEIEHEKLPATWEAWDEDGRPVAFDGWPVSRVFRHERFQNQVLYVRRVETGQTFYGSYNGSPVYGPDGTVALGFITIRDITDQVRATRDLQRLTDELEDRVERRTAELAAANRELEAFGYTVSHDLRAPLRHIAGFAELLRDHAAASLDERAREYVDTISQSAERMGHLIDDLLALSRLGRTSMLQAEVDLSSLVGEAIAELTPAIDGRCIEWHIGTLPAVHGDRTLLRDAVVNLVGNAIKYSRNRNPSRIEIAAELRDGEVVCYVRDNGAGFDMQFAGKLFGVFQRLHGADEFEGTGIGLASVKRIIQRHGGRVWAEGAVGQGATFYFALPGGIQPAEPTRTAMTEGQLHT